MKFAALLLSFVLFSGLAQATPRIGDSAQYNFRRAVAGIVQMGTMSFKLTAHDKARDVWTQSVEITMGNSTEHEEQLIAGKDIITDEVVQNFLSHCEISGGRLETLQIASGPLQTCKLPTEDGFVWIADVPILRMAQLKTSEQGVDSETTLTSFTRGQ